ncbi:hypothetical protein U9M48_021105 [Paspalum notatum var. saurae]|uniref:Uncharacterized protein n=1 Tax=Paspalum notatum var. saurae TaxID=547442 RepID=A0AAQ3WT96_PASNO
MPGASVRPAPPPPSSSWLLAPPGRRLPKDRGLARPPAASPHTAAPSGLPALGAYRPPRRQPLPLRSHGRAAPTVRGAEADGYHAAADVRRLRVSSATAACSWAAATRTQGWGDAIAASRRCNHRRAAPLKFPRITSSGKKVDEQPKSTAPRGQSVAMSISPISLDIQSWEFEQFINISQFRLQQQRTLPYSIVSLSLLLKSSFSFSMSTIEVFR